MNSSRRERALHLFLNDVAGLTRLDERQQALLAQEAALGDEAAFRALVESCLPMVVAMAAGKRGRGLRLHALLATGNRALVQALRQGVEPGALEASLELALESALARVPLRSRSRSL